MAAMGSMCKSSLLLFRTNRLHIRTTVRLASLPSDGHFLTAQQLCLPTNNKCHYSRLCSQLADSRTHPLTRGLAPFVMFGMKTFKTTANFSSGNLTEDILKSKIGEISNKDQNQQQESAVDVDDSKKTEQSSEEPKQKKKDSWFSGKHAWKLGLASLALMGGGLCGSLVMLWGKPLKDKDGNDIEDEFTILPTWQGYPKRAYREAQFFQSMIKEPSFRKLLPDPLKDPWYQPPYTLVLELNGVLVHPDWTLGTGWRFKKRPAVTYFLQQVASPLFEVVIFTHEQGFTAFPIIDGVDPNGHVTFRLFRDATRYMNGSHVKDLDYLNRDLTKVVIVDCDPKAIQKHPRNALLLPKWTGKNEDRTLLDLASFLRTIAMSNVDDVRPVLEHYNQFDDPLEAFKENQRKLQLEQERSAKVVAEKEKSLTGFGMSFLRKR